MPVSHIRIPQKCLNANPKFDEKEQRLIIASMLMQINLPVFRSEVLNLRIRHLGVIKTHGNKKNLKKRDYVRRYNKMYWQRMKAKRKLSEK